MTQINLFYRKRLYTNSVDKQEYRLLMKEHDCVKTLQVSRNLGQTPCLAFFLRARINATGVTGFLYNDFRKLVEVGFQVQPDPFCKVFAGRVLKTLDVVETIVVELVEQRLKGFSKIGEIHHPARFLANRSADVNFNSK